MFFIDLSVVVVVGFVVVEDSTDVEVDCVLVSILTESAVAEDTTTTGPAVLLTNAAVGLNSNSSVTFVASAPVVF